MTSADMGAIVLFSFVFIGKEGSRCETEEETENVGIMGSLWLPSRHMTLKCCHTNVDAM